MTIIKCDVCKKDITKNEFSETRARITITHPFSTAEFCVSCAKKLITLVEKKFHPQYQ